ncbi:MAG: hypothetical protein F6K36_04150 [Symploca sp. SIO3C6]|uniref:Uncharacterized protein n=1 Tax=Symploca sp. SIO1C4 TaxID=2607765 RepID=A0A6B3N235_9CYAN|nr:hypothetical protein [Symploca sp. SIO3C6]NER27756.1 hypothetical protein [Symploca sp. SIO1C4]NET05978.1 hypothetical protein [Symploca sp. SIO2B6]NET53544.1 hypothetical protein [Merismopedia sp. SIO2A8]
MNEIKEQVVEYIELVEPPQPLIENPAHWLKDGESPAEIILATAVLIGALTRFLQVLLPWLRKPSKPKSD